MKSKKCRSILNGLAFVAIEIVFLSYIPFLSSIRREMITVATFLIISDLIFGFIFLRCPYCKKFNQVKNRRDWDTMGNASKILPEVAC